MAETPKVFKNSPARREQLNAAQRRSRQKRKEEEEAKETRLIELEQQNSKRKAKGREKDRKKRLRSREAKKRELLAAKAKSHQQPSSNGAFHNPNFATMNHHNPNMNGAPSPFHSPSPFASPGGQQQHGSFASPAQQQQQQQQQQHNMMIMQNGSFGSPSVQQQQPNGAAAFLSPDAAAALLSPTERSCLVAERESRLGHSANLELKFLEASSDKILASDKQTQEQNRKVHEKSIAAIQENRKEALESAKKGAVAIYSEFDQKFIDAAYKAHPGQFPYSITCHHDGATAPTVDTTPSTSRRGSPLPVPRTLAKQLDSANESDKKQAPLPDDNFEAYVRTQEQFEDMFGQFVGKDKRSGKCSMDLARFVLYAVLYSGFEVNTQTLVEEVQTVRALMKLPHDHNGFTAAESLKEAIKTYVMKAFAVGERVVYRKITADGKLLPVQGTVKFIKEQSDFEWDFQVHLDGTSKDDQQHTVFHRIEPKELS